MSTPPIDPHAVYMRIRAIVELNGSIPEVSRACGIKQASLETYMKGASLPGAMALACLCKGLGVSADWLLFGGEASV